MKRLILAAAAATLLAAGIFVSPPLAEVPRTLGQSDTAPKQGAHAPDIATSPGDLRSEQRQLGPPGAGDGFARQAAHVAAMPPDNARENAVRELAQEWAKIAPAAAARWAKTLEDPAERERALTHVCFEISAEDPLEAIRIARSQNLHPATVDAIVTRWAGADFDAASSWAAGLPDGEMRDHILMRLVQSRAGTAPDEAAALLSESPLSGNMQDEAAMGVLHQWLLKDPEAAREWVDLFPDGPLKERATAAVRGMTAHRGQRSGG